MKVLILANSDIGLFNFRFELIERLLREKHDVFVSCPRGERVDDLISLGVKYFDIKINRHGTNPFEDAKLIRKYKLLMKDTKPDIVFSYTIKPNIYGAIAARRFKVPFVANITGLGTALENEGIKQKLCVILYKFALKSAKKVFFQNQDNLNFFIKKRIVSHNYDLLPGSGVNVEKYSYKRLPETTSFLFMARIMKDKGIDEFLEAAKRVKALYPEVVFDVCGFCDDANYERIIKRSVDEKIVNYHGMVSKTIPFYEKSSCVVLPSYHEGMSNTLLEAASCGRPIIATDIPGCKEIVDDDITGFLVSKKDGNDLANKMISFLKLPYDKKVEMGKLGRKKMKQFFDRETVVSKYMEELIVK